MTIPPELASYLERDPETLSGAIRFKGTRVPLQALLDTVRAGDGIDEFLDGWPNVSRESVEAVLRWQSQLAWHALGLDRAS